MGLELTMTGSSKLFFFKRIGTTNYGASMFIKEEVWANPLGVDIKEFNVIIVSQPLDSNSFIKSEAKQV